MQRILFKSMMMKDVEFFDQHNYEKKKEKFLRIETYDKLKLEANALNPTVKMTYF